MNTSVLRAVKEIRADFCLLFHVAPPLAPEICLLHAAHPPAASPELHSLTAVCCIMEIQF